MKRIVTAALPAYFFACYIPVVNNKFYDLIALKSDGSLYCN